MCNNKLPYTLIREESQTTDDQLNEHNFTTDQRLARKKSSKVRAIVAATLIYSNIKSQTRSCMHNTK